MLKEHANTNSSKKAMEDHYQFFIENIPKHLNIALTWLGKEKFDYSFEEIDAINEVYHNIFQKSQKPGVWYDEHYEVFITYFGETYRKYFLGEWSLNTMKRTFGYGYPIITKQGPEGYPWHAINPCDWLSLTEYDNKEPHSQIFYRGVLKYKNYPEWNFQPLENLKKHL